MSSLIKNTINDTYQKIYSSIIKMYVAIYYKSQIVKPEGTDFEQSLL